ncbi:MAG: hypothetical protein KDE47_08180 [Caldilineaceae bacterium]|nr:hypothetical protein [Caldilineaceae bacterium]
MRDALDALKTVDIVLPVWDIAEGQGANLKYRVITFAKVRITDYRLPGSSRISVRFLGYAHCGDVQAAMQPPQMNHDESLIPSGSDGEEHRIYMPMIAH